MNAAVGKLLEEHDDSSVETSESRRRAEKFRMRRIDYVPRAKRPTQVNGIHRRRRKKMYL